MCERTYKGIGCFFVIEVDYKWQTTYQNNQMILFINRFIKTMKYTM